MQYSRIKNSLQKRLQRLERYLNELRGSYNPTKAEMAKELAEKVIDHIDVQEGRGHLCLLALDVCYMLELGDTREALKLTKQLTKKLNMRRLK